MGELLDFVQTRGLPAAALRARIALDIVENEDEGAALAADRPRVTVASVQIDEGGRAHAPACRSHGELATLLWEIIAGRVADSDELPWSDPADDLPPGVLDIFASLTLRPAKDLGELRRRFAAGIRSHAASHEEVARGLSGPERITLRAPPVQIEALRTLSAAGAAEALATAASPAAPTEDGIVTRVCPVVTLPVVVAPQVDDEPRSTFDPWNAPPLNVEMTATSTSLAVEPDAPRRRRTWPFVGASMIAALALIGLASRQRIASAPTPVAASPAAVSPATAVSARAATAAAVTPATETSALSPSTSAIPSQTALSAVAQTAPRVPPAFRVWPPTRSASAPAPTPSLAPPPEATEAAPVAPSPPDAPAATVEAPPIL